MFLAREGRQRFSTVFQVLDKLLLCYQFHSDSFTTGNSYWCLSLDLLCLGGKNPIFYIIYHYDQNILFHCKHLNNLKKYFLSLIIKSNCKQVTVLHISGSGFASADDIRASLCSRPSRITVVVPAIAATATCLLSRFTGAPAKDRYGEMCSRAWFNYISLFVRGEAFVLFMHIKAATRLAESIVFLLAGSDMSTQTSILLNPTVTLGSEIYL